jgi:pimeloyl-ACP methyl ester carboxylesterase
MADPPLPDVPGVTHREVDLGDVRIHVAEAGDGPPLLLLHGWPQHWWSWRLLMPALAETHRVIAPDLRGWGWSSAPPGDYAKAAFARDVLALLDAEGLDRVQIIGHDWGGYTGFLVALEHPERVDRLVALDIAPPWPGRPRLRHLALPAFASYQVLVGTPGLGPRTMTSGTRFVRTIIRAGSGPDARWTVEELDVYAEVLRRPARAEASSACYRTFLTREAPATLRRGDRSDELHVPTLLLMGGASALRRVIDPPPSRNVVVGTIPGAGHFLPEEAPTQVLEHAVPFLAGRRPPGPVPARTRAQTRG